MFLAVELSNPIIEGERIIINTDQIVSIQNPRHIFFSDGRHIVVTHQSLHKILNNIEIEEEL